MFSRWSKAFGFFSLPINVATLQLYCDAYTLMDLPLPQEVVLAFGIPCCFKLLDKTTCWSFSEGLLGMYYWEDTHVSVTTHTRDLHTIWPADSFLLEARQNSFEHRPSCSNKMLNQQKKIYKIYFRFSAHIVNE